MYPLITVKKGDHLLGRIFLDEQKRSLKVGTTANCHFNTLTQNSVQELEVFRWQDGKLHLCITAEMPLRLQVDERPLDLPALLKLGIAKSKGGRVALVLQQNSDTHGALSLGEYQFAFKFLEKPPAPDTLSLPRSVYMRATLKNFDWRFVIILCCSLASSFWFGSFLYGLPIPQPEQRITNEVTFRFARIVVPPAAITSSVPEGAGDSSAEPAANPRPGKTTASGRELLGERLDSLFSRIDGSLNLPSGGPATKGGRSRILREADEAPAASAQADLKVRTLLDFQAQQRSFADKKIAAIDRRDTGSGRSSGSLDQGSANLVMRGAAGAIRGCYEDALKVDRSLAGKLSMNFNVGSNGQPQALKLETSSALDNSVFLDCIRNVIGDLQFPPPKDGPTPVRFSMIFTPSERQR